MMIPSHLAVRLCRQIVSIKEPAKEGHYTDRELDVLDHVDPVVSRLLLLLDSGG